MTGELTFYSTLPGMDKTLLPDGDYLLRNAD